MGRGRLGNGAAIDVHFLMLGLVQHHVDHDRRKMPGIAADASVILRTRSRRRGCPLAAIAPMFQITILPVSKIGGGDEQQRPFSYSSAMRSRILMSRYLLIDRARGSCPSTSRC